MSHIGRAGSSPVMRTTDSFGCLRKRSSHSTSLARGIMKRSCDPDDGRVTEIPLRGRKRSGRNRWLIIAVGAFGRLPLCPTSPMEEASGSGPEGSRFESEVGYARTLRVPLGISRKRHRHLCTNRRGTGRREGRPPLFPCSSAAERSTVNRRVTGSNPVGGAARCGFYVTWR